MKKNKLVILIICALMLIPFNVSANTTDANTIDFTKTGSISVSLKDGRNSEKKIKGVSFKLYHIAKAERDAYKQNLVYTSEFKTCGFNLDDLRQDGLAERFAIFAEDYSCPSVTGKTSADGTIEFDNLKLGLYLIVQKTSIQGYYDISPFIISIPMTNSLGTEWIYNVDATPKMQHKPYEPPIVPPTSNKLFQTGQLNWPIPILSATGLLFIIIGWKLHIRKRRKDHEV